MKSLKISALLVLAASAAVAHDGVQNATVKARMDAMSAIATNMKTLGKMAKGVTEFDAAEAQNAVGAIAGHAANTPALFKHYETDPKSEAKANIWDDYEGFTQKAVDLERVALELRPSLQEANDVGAALRLLGASCKSCHAVYRE